MDDATRTKRRTIMSFSGILKVIGWWLLISVLAWAIFAGLYIWMWKRK
jgi:hypothetical protein